MFKFYDNKIMFEPEFNEIIDDNISKAVCLRDIDNITMNGVFPIIKISNNFDQKETARIINLILEEIKKENLS